MPKKFLQKVKSQADQDFNRLNEILQFQSGLPKEQRDGLVKQLSAAYDPAFDSLHDLISYSVRKSTDFEKLGRAARAKVQEISDKADDIEKALTKKVAAAEGLLETIRKTAEEQGVSQQAYYFKTEAEKHGEGAKAWLKVAVWLAAATIAYALLALHSHVVPWLKPADTFQAVQIGVGKLLIFATLSFFLGLAAKNYLAHQHNAVVNKHRQNALVTYQALVKAAGDAANRDIVLTKAAECIFNPQTTAFAKGEEAEGKAQSVLSITPQILKQISGG